MRPSKLRPYEISKLLPQDINLRESEHKSIRCPECGTWRMIRRGMVWPHHFEDGTRCEGSARKVVLDLTVDEWHQRLADAVVETASRRPTRVIPRPKAQPALALAQMANPRTLEREPELTSAEQWARAVPGIAAAEAERRRVRQLVKAQPAMEAPAVPTEPLRITG